MEFATDFPLALDKDKGSAQETNFICCVFSVLFPVHIFFLKNLCKIIWYVSLLQLLSLFFLYDSSATPMHGPAARRKIICFAFSDAVC